MSTDKMDSIWTSYSNKVIKPKYHAMLKSRLCKASVVSNCTVSKYIGSIPKSYTGFCIFFEQNSHIDEMRIYGKESYKTLQCVIDRQTLELSQSDFGDVTSPWFLNVGGADY